MVESASIEIALCARAPSRYILFAPVMFDPRRCLFFDEFNIALQMARSGSHLESFNHLLQTIGLTVEFFGRGCRLVGPRRRLFGHR